MYCPKCGQVSDGSTTSCSKCGAPLLVPGSGTLSTASAPVMAGIYAGFWKRLVAMAIDFVILIVLSASLGGVVGMVYGAISGSPDLKAAEAMGNFVGIVVWWLYYAFLESSSKQATLGKMALGIQVVDQQGGRISFGRATGRHFAKVISGMILLIGYLMAGFTAKKQALHDMMAGCLVVNRGASDELIRQGVTAPRMPAWASVLIVLAAVVVPVAILAAVVIPAYQDMTTRGHVTKAVAIGREAARGVEGYYAKHHAFPADLKQAGVREAASSIVKSVSVDARSGAVQVVLALPTLQGKSIVFTPRMEGGDRIVWTCSSPDVRDGHLPANCRK